MMFAPFLNNTIHVALLEASEALLAIEYTFQMLLAHAILDVLLELLH